MSWDEEIARARINKRDAEVAKQIAADQARGRQQDREAKLRPHLETLHRVRAALVQTNWKGAQRGRRLGWGKYEWEAYMPIPEISYMAGLDGRTPQTASIRYSSHPYKGRVIWVQTGGGYDRDDVLLEGVLFAGTRLAQLTPALVLRAAATWCVENSVDLPLGS